MSATLYRKYRPQKFSEMIGQTHIVQTLSNAIKNNRVGQAYLFTGPRGTGKTTLARVFAKAVNCEKIPLPPPLEKGEFKGDLKTTEPCNDCAICQNINEGRSLDVIEIDAASNTGVDNIRELRETVKLPPTQAKYKVYIIDEVHMLSAGAFNALLKTLEEPPAHVIFILATTEIHKVPETILSRCQRFDFSRLTLEQIVKKLLSIAQLEKVEIEKDALEMIAIAAEGGMRDAESLLAQIIALEDKNITAREVEEILGAARHESVEKMADFILEKNTGSALDLASKLSGEGINFEVFHKSLLNYLRQLMIISVSPDLASLFSLELTKEQLKNISGQAENYSPKEILAVLENLIEARQKIRSSFIPSLPLEMAIVKSTRGPEIQNLQPATQNSKPENYKLKPEIRSLKLEANEIKKTNEPRTMNREPQEIDINKIKKTWPELLVNIRSHNHSLMAFLSNCQPVKIENGTIIIATKYNMYKEKLNDKNNRLAIEEVIDKITGSAVKVKFVTEEEAGIKISSKQQEESIKQKDNPLLDDAMKIIGGKVVKE